MNKRESIHETAARETRDLRDRILEAALPHVPFDGWNQRALLAAERDSGLGEGAAYRAFPEGVCEMAAHASDYFDRLMLGRLDELDLAEMKVRERVSAGVRSRIEVCQPHKEATRRLLGFLVLPARKPLAARLAWETCNKIWYAAGDDATDFNYYTKRGLLFPVYTTTVMYWLADESEDNIATWGFLDRRIGDVMRIPGYQARFRRTLSGLPNPFRLLRRTA